MPYFFNSSGCGPPRGVTPASAWPWLDHPVSGLRHATKAPYSDSLSLRLPYAVKLATQRKSLTHYTKGTPSSQLDRSSVPPLFFPDLLASVSRSLEGRLSWDSDCLYACGFRIYCTPLPGFFSPFPHGTGSLSVDHEYLALEDGPPIFRQDFTCPALLLGILSPTIDLSHTGLSPSMAALSRALR